MLLIVSFNFSLFSQEKLQDSLVIKFVENVLEKTEFNSDFKSVKNNSVKKGICDLSTYPNFIDCSNSVVICNLKDKSSLFIFQIFDQKNNRLILFEIVFLKDEVLEIQTYYFKDSLETKVHYKKDQEFVHVMSKTKDKTSAMKVPFIDVQDVLYFYMYYFL